LSKAGQNPSRPSVKRRPTAPVEVPGGGTHEDDLD
jgi:hypothetical protein